MAISVSDRPLPSPSASLDPTPLTGDAAKAGKVARAQDIGATTPFAKLVHALGHEAERGEATVRGVLRGAAGGQELSSSDLLALQAGIYRYGETIDLAAKLVDKATTDLRTVLQGPQ
jgi:hypothetical protein